MQITSFYIFKIKSQYQYDALKKMAFAPIEFRKVMGCQFAKLMGSGGGNIGFGLYPNFKVYVAIMVWENAKWMHEFETKNHLFLAYQKISENIQKIYGTPFKVQGKWSGKQPFQIVDNFESTNSKIIVLTRAKIKLTQVLKFWKFVPNVSKALNDYKGRLFSIGIGEFPLLLQATLSIWDSQEQMQSYAYKNEHHLAAIKHTRITDWYAEELFARFYYIENPFNV